jgi:hypothetical protein
MTCPAPTSAVCGKPATNSPLKTMIPPNSPRQFNTLPPVSSNPLERLAQLVHANDRLIDDLASSRKRIVAALTYLDKPDCNARFGSAHLERCRNRHAGILAQLRANRIEAIHLLGNPPKSNG